MDKAREAHSSFERLALRVAGDNFSEYTALMRGTVKDFMAAHIAYIERLIAIKKQSKHGR